MAWGVITWIGEHPRAFWLATAQHLALSGIALAAALLVGLASALLLLRYPGASGAVIALVNVLRTIPSLAILVIMLPILGTGLPPSVAALALYGLPAILINAYTGLREIDPDIIEAARGQGLSRHQITHRIQIPLALPVIFAGIRTAAVQIVSGATLAAFIGGGGLGELITAGMGTLDIPQLVVGGVAVAMLAIATELAFGLCERLIIGTRAA
jgi:osmoprotectant transport system permease protein